MPAIDGNDDNHNLQASVLHLFSDIQLWLLLYGGLHSKCGGFCGVWKKQDTAFAASWPVLHLVGVGLRSAIPIREPSPSYLLKGRC